MAWHLAQLKIARPAYPLDAPSLADFADALAPVNALADLSPGFVWRLQTTPGDATGVRWGGDDELLVNLSVWQSVLALADFVYGGEYPAVIRRCRERFVIVDQVVSVLWWVLAGHRPTVDQAAQRLEVLRREGPTPYAFTFRTVFPAPDQTRDLLNRPA